jgi:cell volume regulation protein A
VLLVAVAAVRLSVRSGLPSLLLYLGIGVVIGEVGFGIRFDNAQMTQVLGYSALVLILAEGGLSTSWHDIRRSVAPAALLSTLGVVISVVVVALAAHLVLDVSWTVALLVGAIWPPPMLRRCSPSCAGSRSPGGSPACWRLSPDSTTPPW